MPRALLFDMDGTLTVPYFDFPALKAEMGIPIDRPILEALAEMPPAQRATAEEILHRHEDLAATTSTLNAGCDKLLDHVRHAGIKTALITRNSRRSVQSVLARHACLSFDLLLTRECVNGKVKPDAEPLQFACRQLGVESAETWMIGDSHHDIDAGAAAGIRTIWISHGQPLPADYRNQPWRTMRDLGELLAFLRDSRSAERSV